MNLPTATAEILRILSDDEWHSMYEPHAKYRLSPLEIYASVTTLIQLKLVERRENEIRLVVNMEPRNLSIMNRLLKTRRPVALGVYDRTLTKGKISV